MSNDENSADSIKSSFSEDLKKIVHQQTKLDHFKDKLIATQANSLSTKDKLIAIQDTLMIQIQINNLLKQKDELNKRVKDLYQNDKIDPTYKEQQILDLDREIDEIQIEIEQLTLKDEE
ncbi:Spike_glycoprotein S2 superfamily [Hexamita inflata]|uniref:Coronavirus n=1 Tax=Hexamita inflata TaxID=28002 RepID=A0AA86N438_9EUKA|nr:Spike glycoprotein S2 superfamily [Hexamita inflata]